MRESNGALRHALARIDTTLTVHGGIRLCDVSVSDSSMHCRTAATLFLKVQDDDIAKAFKTLDEWNLPPARKADVLQQLLLHVYQAHILRLMPRDSEMATLTPATEAAVVGALRQIASHSSENLQAVCQDIIKFWNPETAVTPASLEAKLDRFHTLLK